jgi:hypothetical protein
MDDPRPLTLAEPRVYDGPDQWSWAFVVVAPSVGWPGYLVATDGAVWRKPRPKGPRSRNGQKSRWLRLSPVWVQGYAVVTLFRDGRRKMVKVHRLVLDTFVGQCPEGMEGCHNNGDKTNNNLWNLRWDTPHSNMRDRDSHGRTARGSRNAAPRSGRTMFVGFGRDWTVGRVAVA